MSLQVRPLKQPEDPLNGTQIYVIIVSLGTVVAWCLNTFLQVSEVACEWLQRWEARQHETRERTCVATCNTWSITFMGWGLFVLL